MSQEIRRYSSAALEASHVVKDSKGMLHSLTFTNTNAAARYLQVFDANALPADSTVPAITIQVAAGATINLNYDMAPLPFQSGIVVCNSSTAGTKTIGAADSHFCVGFA